MGVLNPLEAAWGLLWLSSSLGLCSTASRLGRRLPGYREGQGSATMLEHPRLCGICSGTVPAGRESRLLPDPEDCSNARVILCNVRAQIMFTSAMAAGRVMHTLAPQTLHAEPLWLPRELMSGS